MRLLQAKWQYICILASYWMQNQPEEILGVIAHELGHLKAGHVPRRDEAMRDASNAGTLAALAAIALAAGGAPSDAVVGVAIGGNDRARRSMLQSFRYDEAVADELGLEYLKKQASHLLAWSK